MMKWCPNLNLNLSTASCRKSHHFGRHFHQTSQLCRIVVLGWIQAEKLNVVINPEAISEVEQPGPPLHLGNVGTEMRMISSSARAKRGFCSFQKCQLLQKKAVQHHPHPKKKGQKLAGSSVGQETATFTGGHWIQIKANKARTSSLHQEDPNRCYSYLLNLLEATVFSGNCVKCVFTSFPLHNQINCFVWLKYSLVQIPEIPILPSLWVVKSPTAAAAAVGKGDVRAEHVWRHTRPLTGSERVKDFCPSWKGRERQTDEREFLLSEWKRRRRERERVACVSVCSRCVCALTPAARPPSPLILWRALCSSGPFFFSLPFPLLPFLSISCPFLSAFPPCFISLLFSPSLSPPTMVQDFYRRGRRAALLTEVSCVDGVMDEWMRQSLAANES